MAMLSRRWATPLTMGAFALMAVTGGLMFFHIDLGISHEAHEWLGWLLIAAVAMHATVNWPALRRYLGESGPPRWLLGSAVLALAACLLIPMPGEEGMAPPMLALKAMTAAPLDKVAALTGQDPQQVVQLLASQGLPANSSSQTLDQLTQGDRERTARALRVLLAPAR